jgi:phage-related protein
MIVISVKLYQDNVQMRKENPLTTNYAVRPDEFLVSAHRDIKRHYYKTSVKRITRAIKAIKHVGNSVDDKSTQTLESAVEELRAVEDEMNNYIIDHEHIRIAFANTLNALAYAQLRMAERFIETGEPDKARMALEYALKHLDNAMRFLYKDEADIEKEIYLAIDTIVAAGYLEEETLINTIDMLLAEMDTTLLTMN